VALIPIGYVYGRLTERMPDAGSEIAYTSIVFPEAVSFAAGWMMTLAYLIVCPYEAVAIGRSCSYLFPQMNSIALGVWIAFGFLLWKRRRVQFP
jgi:basic amino acid/polyamine antiporter, APA family